MTAEVEDLTFRALFRNRSFAVLYVAQTQSLVGDQLARVALAVLVFSRTGSGLITAATYALTFLPAFLGGLLLTHFADTRPRRALMVACDVIRFALFALMAVPGLPLPLVSLALVIAVFVSTPYNAAEPAVVADLFQGPRYQMAIGLRTATSQATQLAGFAIGGVVVAAVGADRALAIDAATFAVAAVLVRVGLDRFPAPAAGVRARHQLAQGAAAIANNPALRLLLAFAWLDLFWIVPEGLAAPYAAGHGSGPIAVGVLLAAMPTGNLIGTLVLTRIVPVQVRSGSIGMLAAASGLPLVACLPGPPLWAAALLWALSGAFSSYLAVVIADFVGLVPSTVRGQAIGLASSSLLAVQGVGLILGGGLAVVLGNAAAVAAAGAAGSVLAVVLAFAYRRASGRPDRPARHRRQ